MHKMTLYVPEELRRALARVATARRCSEAELIREALRELTARAEPPRPKLPLFASRKPRLAERHDTGDVLTLDERHFRALRAGPRRRFRVLPADA